MNIHQRNFLTVNTMLKYDGDIPMYYHEGLVAKGVQIDKLASNDNADLFYIASYEEQYGDVEAYVVCDNRGNVSYHDVKHEVICYMNEVREDWIPCTQMPSLIADEFENLFNKYYFEGGERDRAENRTQDGIEPFLELLKKCFMGRY